MATCEYSDRLRARRRERLRARWSAMGLGRFVRAWSVSVALAISAAAFAKTEVLVFFDAEDFTSDRANDSIRDLADLCREEGVRAQFAIVGYLAHEIMRHGRKDVMEALKPHVIGTQSLYHSIHPNILEKSDHEDHELAYWSVYADELLGNKWITEMTGAKLMCAVPPGNSKSYVAMYAYADMGIPFYCDTVVTDGQDGDISYCNIRQIPYYYAFMLESMLPDRCAGEPDYGKALDGMSARKRVILFMHPNSAIFTEFWDSLNYLKGAYTPFGQWKVSRERPAAETAEFYGRLRTLFRKLRRDPRFELTDLERLAAAEVPRKAISRDEIPALLAAMKGNLGCTRNPSRSVADVFQAAVRFLRGERLAPPSKVYGFLSRPVGVKSPVEVTASELRAAAAKIDLGTFLPASIPVGDTAIGPADFLVAALEVLATGAEKVTVTPKEQLGNLDGFAKLRDFKPRGGWILPADFKDNYVSDRLRWQFWTLRYND